MNSSMLSSRLGPKGHGFKMAMVGLDGTLVWYVLALF